MTMEVNIEDLMIEVAEPITIVLTNNNGFDEYGLPDDQKATIETNAYVSSRAAIGLYDTTGGSFVDRDSFEFYIPTSIYMENEKGFRSGGFIYYKDEKYQINSPKLQFRFASRVVIDCGYIGPTENEMVMP